MTAPPAPAGPRRGLLLGGVGRYTDPWHPFPVTNAALVSVAREAGVDLTAATDIDAALADLADGPLPELVVMNLGLPQDDAPVPAGPRPAAGLARLLESRTPVLAVHASTTCFPGDATWEALLGGTWVRDTTTHPPYGRAHVLVTDPGHPLTTGLTDFDLDDERYTDLRVSPKVRVLLTHEHEGGRHPLLWVHTRPGGGTTVYDALGHDGRSYESEEHRLVLRRAVGTLR
ncbi:ThuA domain-containing protein [Streptomyces sp. VRA16 Mangrove soil]|uniref:ThuA domain-containing protein n=1 Tax=Streptomyces sp. VRA16 Mangrove soil TaxID=2817434 RepID=UPI001A9D53AA|nr:ThuA domain-containing protein [Streptomyces sp. VRA16 Mangrove soil]MBO1334567.1 ThuA domain-containing protein [Streptomyces sp. VRA16 Mangrove soil]